MSSLIEEVFNRINTHKGIEGIILCDMEGTPIKTTLNTEQTYFYTTSAAIFIKRCKNIVTELVKEELAFIRIRTKHNEIMIAPDNEFVLVVIQNPSTNN